jgi:hypothetical protein
MENADARIGEPASRCGLSLRGSEGPIRDAVTRGVIPVVSVEGRMIAITWSRDVAWRKRIRFPKH